MADDPTNPPEKKTDPPAPFRGPVELSDASVDRLADTMLNKHEARLKAAAEKKAAEEAAEEATKAAGAAGKGVSWPPTLLS